MARRLFSLRTIVGNCLIIQAFLLVFTATGLALPAPTTQPLVMHFPGIGGYLVIDRLLLAGLAKGGVKGRIQAFDWTMHDPGIDALHGYDRNHKQAAAYANLIAGRIAQWPDASIVLISHSGGGGITIWTLEDLPPGVQVDAAILLAPALSPDYDLSAALRHVRRAMYVFYSQNDYLILGTGCRIFGTMDGEFTDAAGFVGFKVPKLADANEYKKLRQFSYDPAWAWLGNFGDHIGTTSLPFAAKIIAPLVIQAETR
jgi:pimeloyl-ACP methyl ester carboxylesterase